MKEEPAMNNNNLIDNEYRETWEQREHRLVLAACKLLSKAETKVYGLNPDQEKNIRLVYEMVTDAIGCLTAVQQRMYSRMSESSRGMYEPVTG